MYFHYLAYIYFAVKTNSLIWPITYLSGHGTNTTLAIIFWWISLIFALLYKAGSNEQITEEDATEDVIVEEQIVEEA